MSPLLIIVPTVWLLAVTFVVLLCRGAALGDAAMLAEQAREHRAPPSGGGSTGAAARAPRVRATQVSRVRGRVLRVRDDRARGARCAAGS